MVHFSGGLVTQASGFFLHPINPLFMVLKNLTFNHEADNFHEAIGVNEKQRNRCRERVFFATIANALQGLELYEDDDDRPAEFTSKTGDLSRTLKLIEDPIEYEYTLFMFIKYQSLAQESVAKWVAMNNSDLSESSKAKLKIMMQLEDLILDHHAKHGDDDDDRSKSSNSKPELIVTPGSMLKRIDLVKQSHYSFDTYYNMVEFKNLNGAKRSSGSDFDVDDLLRNAFRDDE